MDYTVLKNFKARYFLLFFVLCFFVSIFFSMSLFEVTGIGDWITLGLSLCCLFYVLYQTKKWKITYNEQSVKEAMTKGRWGRFLSLTAFIQISAVSLGTMSISLLFLLFEEQIRNLLFLFPISEVVPNMPLIVYVLFFINICILAPIWEELFFRGVLLRRFTLKWSPQKSIIISSLLFGIIHINPLNMLFAFGLGCVLGYAYLKTKSIIVPMLLHSFSNFLAFIQYCIANQSTGSLNLPEKQAVQTELYISGIIFLVFFLSALILLIKNYKHFRALSVQTKNVELPVE
ncbi:CPBP family intramembrane metalloprotease [Lysinibacillus sp. 2017]|uniref:CPBP family intramembrane glutamic endopeptidase n=1 Tax=unclassified Lysinibacillus TaxID=2636778 RepID=UPI000D529B5B|nr:MULTISPECIES: CPBP family intramembrane glutamic endopeptidase [unclassified Lysinibacillus]AWE07947.1 CPBP family intramembrane metalloprotease [Lysinibacillus sp. 2017]TGN31587.1 CPBP family intramembrane metalloprotease [Lysinibacillus sp. S2017]